MFLDEGEINPAYPFLVTVMINPCFNEAEDTLLKLAMYSMVLVFKIIIMLYQVNSYFLNRYFYNRNK